MNTTLTTAAVHDMRVPDAMELMPVVAISFCEPGASAPSLAVQGREARALAASLLALAERLDQARFAAEEAAA